MDMQCHLLFQTSLEADDIKEAVARWMQENLRFVVFSREVEEHITEWGDSGFMQTLCNCGILRRRKHIIIPVGVVAGVISPTGIWDMVIYQHQDGDEREPWTLRFAWANNQITHAERNQPESAMAAWDALCRMPLELGLTDY